jgi:hypothetical protein
LLAAGVAIGPPADGLTHADLDDLEAMAPLPRLAADLSSVAAVLRTLLKPRT